MRCLLICFLLLSFFHSQAIGKVVLWGQVCDAEGRPIEQAVVGIPNTPLGTVTDSEGNYRLSLAPGQHRIAVSSLGYAPFQKDINLQESTQLNITLNPDNIKIESIDIQAKGKSQQMRETVFAINTLDIKPQANTQNNLANIIGRTTASTSAAKAAWDRITTYPSTAYRATRSAISLMAFLWSRWAAAPTCRTSRSTSSTELKFTKGWCPSTWDAMPWEVPSTSSPRNKPRTT